MSDGPITDKGEMFVSFYKRLPDSVKHFYKALIPESLRQRTRNTIPFEQDLERTVRFWANPWERRRRMAQLRGCRTPEDYFDFAAKYLGHQQWKQEILGFLNFAMAERPVRMCEVGLFLGGTNLMFRHVLPTVQLFVGVDLHVRNKSQLRYFANSSQRQIFVEGLSCDDATLAKVAQTLGGEKLDLLFLDADHSYAGVKQDFMRYRHFVREGGIIAFHDIVPDHRRKAHDPASWGADSGEVYLFWRNLKPYYANTREFVVDYDQDGCGIGALTYSSKVAVPEDL